MIASYIKKRITRRHDAAVEETEDYVAIEKKLRISVNGRLSSEMVSKCARWGLPVIASRTAPTDLAVGIAEKSGITLIGFVRGDRMNIYANTQRIK